VLAQADQFEHVGRQGQALVGGQLVERLTMESPR
jgi:hypothetical protein